MLRTFFICMKIQMKKLLLFNNIKIYLNFI
ncbi:hypothetical protein LI17339_20650 [Bacillus licheniformis LMG 17339]|jgi:hypothetical protein|nr:hypothetical protein LI17339_20650 [Bacillus licheniformis LMG 17339]